MCTATAGKTYAMDKFQMSVSKYNLQFLKAFITGSISAAWIRSKNDTPFSLLQLKPATEENLKEKYVYMILALSWVSSWPLYMLTSLLQS